MTFISDKYKCAPTSVGCISSFEFARVLVTVTTTFDVRMSVETLTKTAAFLKLFQLLLLVMPTYDVVFILD